MNARASHQTLLAASLFCVFLSWRPASAQQPAQQQANPPASTRQQTQIQPAQPLIPAGQRGPTGRTYGPVGPGISVDDVLVRKQTPVLTLSDTASGKDAVLRNFGGDLRLGFIAEGGSVRGVDLSRYDDRMFLRPDGNFGIGNEHPAHRLSIAGGPPWTSNGWKGAVELENGAALAWKQNSAGQNVGIGHTNGGLYFFRTTSNPATNTAAAQYDLVIKDDGAVNVRALEIDGADVAENFRIEAAASVSQTLRPGIVVSIDPKHPGSLVMSDRRFDRRVAGVISGAGGIEPGVLMAGRAGTGSYPVALTGRVYCWADASAGAISPGDHLTTSSTPGHAMKVNDYSAVQGAIIGKAMTGLSRGRGLVLVLVTLQ